MAYMFYSLSIFLENQIFEGALDEVLRGSQRGKRLYLVLRRRGLINNQNE